MFKVGQVFKVKVETAVHQVGFGRAVVIEKHGNHLFVQIRTSKEPNLILPKGARLCFVSDSASNTFNGLWTTTVVGAKIIGGKTVMECANPKLEPAIQKRKSQRVPLACPIKLVCEPPISYDLHSFNISRSGIGLETAEQYVDEFPVGEQVEIVIESPTGDIPVVCRVIRTQYNWLANRTTIGLEFVEMDNESRERLNALVNTLRGQDMDMAEQTYPEGNKSKLSGWMKASQDNPRFVQSSRQDLLKNKNTPTNSDGDG